MMEQSKADRRTRPAVAPLIGTPTGASQARDAEPHDAEITDLAQYRRRAVSGPRLSAASAASVREAAIAVLSGEVRYLPVVEDGTLVGLVAVAPQPVPSVLPAAHTHPTLSTAHGRRPR
jgi:CBS domain-containing protein